MNIKKYKSIMQRVVDANLSIRDYKLTKLTWGNASECLQQEKLMFIKPSGYDLTKINWRDIVIMNFKGDIIYAKHAPSVDSPIHLALYNKHSDVEGVVHTHSPYATAFAQARQEIKILGTTHADTFPKAIKVTKPLTKFTNLEASTGVIINDLLTKEREAASIVGAVLVAGHGPFTFGTSAMDAFQKSLILEEIARLNFITNSLGAVELEKSVVKYHYSRKHGKGSYYGQKN